MSGQWIGCAVSVKYRGNDGDINSFQGIIRRISEEQLVLSRVFKDGLPHSSGTVCLSVKDIIDLYVLEEFIEPSKLHNGARLECDSYDEDLSLQPEQLSRLHIYDSNQPNADVVEFESPVKFAIKKKNRKLNEEARNAACFGGDINEIKSNEFDFEGNLALFDKKDLFLKLDKLSSPKKKSVFKSSLALRPPKVINHHVCDCLESSYFTDGGMRLKCVDRSIIKQLQDCAERYGLSLDCQRELMGRNVADMALQLLGLSYRSFCDLRHQTTLVTVICGEKSAGAVGLNTARHLASHGVGTFVLSPKRNIDSPSFLKELSLYNLTLESIINDVQELPISGVDLVILSLEKDLPEEMGGMVLRWLKSQRCTIIAIDPPTEGYSFMDVKISVIPIWPVPHSERNGKLFLSNLSLPRQVYLENGIDYTSPFGSKNVVQIYKSLD